MNAGSTAVPTKSEFVDEPMQGAEAETEVTQEAADETKHERTWTEEIELAGSQLVEKVKELIAEGNVRRLILRTPDDSMLIEIPLVAGAVVGGVLTVFALPLAVLGAIASVLAHVKVEIVRTEEADSTETQT